MYAVVNWCSGELVDSSTGKGATRGETGSSESCGARRARRAAVYYVQPLLVVLLVQAIVRPAYTTTAAYTLYTPQSVSAAFRPTDRIVLSHLLCILATAACRLTAAETA